MKRIAAEIQNREELLIRNKLYQLEINQLPRMGIMKSGFFCIITEGNMERPGDKCLPISLAPSFNSFILTILMPTLTFLRIPEIVNCSIMNLSRIYLVLEWKDCA